MDNIETLNRLAREYNCAPVTPACLAGAAALARVAELEAALADRRTELADARWRVAELEAELAEWKARTIREGEERDRLRGALNTVHNWLVCYAIATPEDMCQSIPDMELIAAKALAGPAPEGGAG